MQACLHLFLKKEHSITRRIDTWLFGPSDERAEGSDTNIAGSISGSSNYGLDEQKQVLQYFVDGYVQLLRDQRGEGTEVHTPLKVLLNFY